jgi:carboxylesterase
MRVAAGGEPFFFKGSDVGCLLVHGFPGTPAEMYGLGESLHQRGFSVLGIRLFGHATEPADLLRVQSHDWLADLESGYHLLRGSCSKIILIGFSLGGVLSATFAASFKPDALVLMAMPMDLPKLAHRLRPLLPFLRIFWRYRHPSDESDWHDKEAERKNLHYEVQPLQAVGQIFDLIQQLPQSLARLDLPTLLIYSKDDASVPVDHGSWALDSIPAQDKQLIVIEGSGHSLACDAQRNMVFRKVGDFILEIGEAVR